MDSQLNQVRQGLEEIERTLGTVPLDPPLSVPSNIPLRVIPPVFPSHIFHKPFEYERGLVREAEAALKAAGLVLEATARRK